MTTVDTTSTVESALGEAAELALGGDASWAAGLSLAVTDCDKIITQGAHGLADVAAAKPATTSTVFEIGSISKGFTAALVLQARDSGLLDLDEPVSTYLPWFEVQSRFAPITVRHLLTHTAGIIGGTEFTGDAAFEVWSLRDTQTSVAPGTWFYYSNTGYKALGQLLQAVYRGRPYEQLLADHLLSPLGMTASESAITHETRRRMAVGYAPFYDDRPARRADGLAPATWVETATADGSIASTAADMTAWLRLLMRDGTGPDNAQLVQAASVREMLTAAIPADAPDESYGLGMYVRETDGHRVVSHTGGMVGYNAAVICDLELGLGAVVLANGSGPWAELAQHAILSAHAARNGSAAPEFALPATETKPDQPAQVSDDAPPNEWAPLVGHYRCYNPWLTNIRVQHHADKLWMWAGEDSTLGEPLVQLDDGSFRVGADERCPDRLRFDVVIDGKTTRATLDGCAYYRTFTP